MYAIIEDSGSQIKVSQGDKIRIAMRPMPKDGKTFTFDRVLMVGEPGQQPKIGAPLLKGAKVTAEFVNEAKTDKVPVIKFRPNKNYVRRRGHRQPYLAVRITAISQ